LIYRNQGDYPQALDYFQRSLKINEELGDKKGIATSLSNMGTISNQKGDYPKALDYRQRSLKINEELGDKNGIASSLNNMGVIYSKQGDYSKALDYYQRSLKMREEMGDKNGIAASLNNIGIIYKDLGDYPQALDYYQRSLKIKEEIGDKKGIANSLHKMGSLYQDQEDYENAIDFCNKGLLLARKIGSTGLQRNACICLYDAYKATGNGNKALEYHEQMLALDDSLNAEETQKKLQQMEFQKAMLQDSIAKAEEDRLVQEAHEEEMRQEAKTRNWSIAGGVLALLLAGGFYSRWRYVQKSKTALQTEKDRSDNLLLNILPAEIAQELKEKGKADARDFEMVSILFTDFKSFTEHSEKLSAAELVNEINHCFEAFDGIMEKYGIEKIKTIGDAYMAAGGLPVPTEDSVKNTVLAALEMQQFIAQRHQYKVQRGEPAFEMRVGIHTGPVVAGIVGVKKFQYDIWGDTVNTASRMESAGEVGKVNISQATYEFLTDTERPALSGVEGSRSGSQDFMFESRGKIEAKGKGEMEMYFVAKKENPDDHATA
jgi:class 3 adenylate cyclase/Tfp pilus assembly protein PilF